VGVAGLPTAYRPYLPAVYQPVSLVISNFKTGREELLQKNIAGYDQVLQVQSIRRLFETIGILMKWEAQP
jgi:hypothetical protein